MKEIHIIYSLIFLFLSEYELIWDAAWIFIKGFLKTNLKW